MGILLVYDVTNEGSFNNINQWMLAIRQHASSSVNKVLLGNKADTSGPLVAKRAVATASFPIFLSDTCSGNQFHIQSSNAFRYFTNPGAI